MRQPVKSRDGSIRGVSPHMAVARRQLRLAAIVLAIGLVGALVLFLTVDDTTLPVARACTGACQATARWVTRFGEGWETLLPGGLVLIACGVRLWRRWPIEERLGRFGWTMAFLVVAIGGSGIVSSLLKTAIGRARPFVDVGGAHLAFRPFAFSSHWAGFPSGHATTAGATAMALALLFPRRAGLIFAGFLIVAVSRVVVAAHYPSDVSAGFAFGVAFTLVTAALFLTRGRVFQLCGGRLHRLPIWTSPCVAAGVPRPDGAAADTRARGAAQPGPVRRRPSAAAPGNRW